MPSLTTNSRLSHTAATLLFGALFLAGCAQGGGSGDPSPGGSCQPSELACDDKCVPLAQLCDGTEDCSDGSDERSCPSACDLRSHFACGDSTCIERGLLCDGQNNCRDGSDERDCPTSDGCSGFECSDGTCIGAAHACDGFPDCASGDDEEGCPGGGGGLCGELTWEGQCTGTVLEWCDSGESYTVDCAVNDQICAWQDDQVGYACRFPEGSGGGGGGGECEQTTFEGSCAGDELTYCNDGEVIAVDCAALGRSCAWDGPALGYNCVP